MGKLNILLRTWPSGTVAVQPWLLTQGISRQLAQKYLQHGWIDKVGNGAFVKAGEKFTWLGGIYALQRELGLPIYVGGRTALELMGRTHFVALGNDGPLYLYSHAWVNTQLPKWFLDAVKPKFIVYTTNSYFAELGLTTWKTNNFVIQISTAERAILEVLSVVPKRLSYEHALYLMEGQVLLRANLVQNLLEHCSSIKTKRLFLHLAHRCELKLLSELKLEYINLGKGRRIIGKGVVDQQFNLEVPRFEIDANSEV